MVVYLAVIEAFKAAVLFEQDRRENDARVTSVFLAQTDMMRVLLEYDSFFHLSIFSETDMITSYAQRRRHRESSPE